jgi:MFS transporter, FHS family, L-fucose permease
MRVIAMAATARKSDSTEPALTYRELFSIITVLFSTWGFRTIFNDILPPRFKEALTLRYYLAMFVPPVIPVNRFGL